MIRQRLCAYGLFKLSVYLFRHEMSRQKCDFTLNLTIKCEPIWEMNLGRLFLLLSAKNNKEPVVKTGPLLYRSWRCDKPYRRKLHTNRKHAATRFGKIELVGCAKPNLFHGGNLEKEKAWRTGIKHAAGLPFSKGISSGAAEPYLFRRYYISEKSRK